MSGKEREIQQHQLEGMIPLLLDVLIIVKYSRYVDIKLAYV
jgi:hypothetical protein